MSDDVFVRSLLELVPKAHEESVRTAFKAGYSRGYTARSQEVATALQILGVITDTPSDTEER